jgi:hypothetical protein
MLARACARYIAWPSHLGSARGCKGLNLNHRRIVEAALIRAEAIGRTEPHTEVAMKDQAERFPTVVASHGFNIRQTSLALPRFPDYAKPTPKPSAGSRRTQRRRGQCGRDSIDHKDHERIARLPLKLKQTHSLNSDSSKTGRRWLNSRRPENAGPLVPSSSVNPRRRTMFVGDGRLETTSERP